MTAILDSVASSTLPPQQITAAHRRRLLDHKSLGARAEKLLGDAVKSNRAEVIKRYASVLDLAGDATRGKQHFGKACVTCHRLEDVGHIVGPDLVALTDKSTPAMLTAILDPNAAIEDKYLSYLIVTEDGRQFSGLLISETTTSITLLMADGKQQPILRRDIDELRATGKSLMPEGLELNLPPQAIADIVAYTQSVSVPHRTFPGNEPQIAPVRDDGSIRLFAMHAKIYGSQLEFEPQYRNLGMWSQPTDRAVWILNVPRKGTYRVRMDYACDGTCTGNRLQVIANGQKITVPVAPTDSWDDYRTKSIGKLNLPRGEIEITLKSDGTINQYLGDFRTIILEP